MTEKELTNYQWNEHIRFPPHLNRSELESLHFIERKENLVLTGAPGTGKSHLVTALGRKACRDGYEVHFYRVADLVELLEKHWREGRYQQFRNKFNKVNMIILDEMGYIPFSKDGAELLFQLISDWYEQRSLVITSNLEFSQWNKVFVDARLSAALVDRVIHHAHILSFTRDSYRVQHALSKKQNIVNIGAGKVLDFLLAKHTFHITFSVSYLAFSLYPSSFNNISTLGTSIFSFKYDFSISLFDIFQSH